MSLPKTETPIFTTTLSSNGKKVRYRPMKAREEKNLLIAKVSEDLTDIFNAIAQVVQNCVLDEFHLETTNLFDLEELFLKIRGSSVSNIITQIYTDLEDKKQYNFNINIDNIRVVNLKTPDEFKIMLTDDVGLTMKYPSALVYQDKEFLNSTDDTFDRLAVRCIDKIFNGDDVMFGKDFQESELLEWLDELPIDAYNKVEHFVATLPHLFYELKYTNSLGKERTITLSTLSDFFMLH